MGIRGSSTCELIFEDCRIPKGPYAGRARQGFQLAMATTDGGHIGIASRALGIAEGALEDGCLRQERKRFGRPIAAFQNTQFELAEMKARVEAQVSGLRCRSEEAAGYGQRRRKGPLAWAHRPS